MQRSAPGLKNARRRLTIRPPLVPTTGTAKPILKQRKPPADPGLAPFKKKNARFPKLIDFFWKLKKYIAQQQSGLARSARICCSQPRPPPPFHSCAPGPGARSGSAPGDVRRGARALVAVRPPRGSKEGARSGGAGSACPGGAWGAGRREDPAGGAARIPARREPPGARTGHLLLPWPPAAAPRGRVSTRPGDRPPHNGCERRERSADPPLPGDSRWPA